ncbi:MAG: hypothetical protein K6U87_14780 [Firmicutes bacterium]|nr:hypothetical protein [Bacillota bacterium]
MVEWIPASSLKVVVQPEPLALPNWLQQAVDAHWQMVIRDHPHFYRGPVLSVVAVSQRGAERHVLARFTDYAHYLFSRHLPLADRFRVCPLFAAACPITREGYLVVGQMAEATARPLLVQAIGGTATPVDVEGTTFLATGSALRQLHEVLGIDPARDLAAPAQLVGAAYEPGYALALAVRIDLPWDWPTLEARTARYWAARQAGQPTQEHSRLLALPWGEAGLEVLRSAQWEAARYLEAFLTQPSLRP